MFGKLDKINGMPKAMMHFKRKYAVKYFRRFNINFEEDIEGNPLFERKKFLRHLLESDEKGVGPYKVTTDSSTTTLS